MIIFKELILENFGPYKGKNIIDLSINNNDNNSPIILLGGMNGGGKTTLMDSLRLVLYGKRAECFSSQNISYNDFLLQCINKQIDLGEKTRIELTFEHIVNNQWIELKIVRYWEQNVKDGKDNLGIIEGDFPDLNLANNWDEYIENFLPLGISNLFLFDGEQVKELAEQDLPSPQVKDAIKSLLGLELADKLARDLDFLIGRKQKELAQDDRLKELETFEAQLINLEKEKEILIGNLSIAEKKVRKNNRQYSNTSKKLRKTGIEIASETENLKIKKDKLIEQRKDIKSNLLKLSSRYLPLALIPNLIQDLTIQLEEESELLKLKNAQSIFQNRDKKLLSFLQQVNIQDEQYQEIVCFLASENTQLNQQIDSQNSYLLAPENTLTKLTEIKSCLPIQQQQTQEYLLLLDQLTQELNLVEEELLQIESPEVYRSLEKQCQQEQKKLLQSKVEYEKLKDKLEGIKKEIITITKKLGKYSEADIKNQQTKHIVDVLPKVKKTLSLFQQNLTLRKLNKLELEVTNCFRYLLHKSNLISRVGITIDTFALSLYNNEGNLIPKQRLSAGEKQLLAIALLWGLARVSEKNLPIAIDTPLARLDSSHRYNLIERYFPTASHQVILLSTDTEIGKSEVNLLRKKQAIAREYLLDYDTSANITKIKEGYFY